ncbi:MAG: zinc-ribbon domain-containing protein, partial [Candidatus Heimdallarchaeota archaeon]|nr:zinc-ribbon domain-containing protein [Candidatus Heimdallarchaeota archaeon]
LASCYPELAEEWYQEKNGEISPDKVVAGSGKLYWWKCDKGPDHIWKTSLSNRTRVSGGGCPFCAGQKVSVTNSLASLHPDLAKEWYQEKNGKITSDKVVAGSGKLYWWKCDKGPDHIWKTSPRNRTKRRATGCPYCNLGDVEMIGYLWERICHRIAQQLLREEKWSWQPMIETPDFEEKNWIVPEILIEKPDGSSEIIEVKKSPHILKFKDLVIYPEYAKKVIFWCLNLESPIEIDSEENFVFISSDELVDQLKNKITDGNKSIISRIINDIKKLKEGTLLSQQKLLTEFMIVDE